jgi:hypothetical protein
VEKKRKGERGKMDWKYFRGKGGRIYICEGGDISINKDNKYFDGGLGGWKLGIVRYNGIVF